MREGLFEKLSGLGRRRASPEQIRAIAQEARREVFNGRGAFRNFIIRKARNEAAGRIEAASRDVQNLKRLKRNPNSKSVRWKSVDPEIRPALVEKVAGALRQVKSAPTEKRPPKKKKILPRLHRKVERGVKSAPAPRDTGLLVPQSPPIQRSPLPYEKDPRETYRSRVGYNVSISDMYFYIEEPRVTDEPYMHLDFADREEGHLALGAGQEWVSPWYESRVLRGVNVNVTGTHRLSYTFNGSFEE